MRFLYRAEKNDVFWSERIWEKNDQIPIPEKEKAPKVR